MYSIMQLYIIILLSVLPLEPADHAASTAAAALSAVALPTDTLLAATALSVAALLMKPVETCRRRINSRRRCH